MKAWERRQVDQLCKRIGAKVPDIQYGSPLPLIFGQQGDPGASGKVARADHRHAMGYVPFDSNLPFVFTDLATRSSSDNTIFKVRGGEVFGSNSGLVNDEPTASGAFGIRAFNFAAGAAGTNFHYVMSQNATGGSVGDTTVRAHSFQRLSVFEMRVRVRATATPADHKCAIGAVHETVNADIDAIDDGVYFFIDRDSSGVGNFHAITKSSTTGLTTDTDLGTGWDFTGNGQFMTFRIEYDLTSVFFFLQGILAATHTDNIPTLKLQGWGYWAEMKVNVPNTREIWASSLIFAGRA